MSDAGSDTNGSSPFEYLSENESKNGNGKCRRVRVHVNKHNQLCVDLIVICLIVVVI